MWLRDGMDSKRPAWLLAARPVAFFVTLLLALALVLGTAVSLSGCGRGGGKRQDAVAVPATSADVPATSAVPETSAMPASSADASTDVSGVENGMTARDVTAMADKMEAEINIALARAGVDPLQAKRLDKLEVVTTDKRTPTRPGPPRGKHSNAYSWERRWQTLFAMPTPSLAGMNGYVELLKLAAAAAGGSVFVVEPHGQDAGMLVKAGFDGLDGQRFVTHVILVMEPNKLSGQEAWDDERAGAGSGTEPGRSRPAPSSPLPEEGRVPKHDAYISIIIDDWGYNQEVGRRFLALPQPLTMAVIPFAPHSEELLAEGVAKGWEPLLHLPMEPVSSFWELGRGSIDTSLSEEEIRERIEEDLAALPGVVGVNNHMGSKATADERVMDAVMKVIKDKGLFFVDSRTSARSVAEKAAAAYGVEHAANQVFLDNVDSVDAVTRRIDLLVDVARHSGTAVGIGHVRANTVEAIARALPTLAAQGVHIVPIKELLAFRGQNRIVRSGIVREENQ